MPNEYLALLDSAAEQGRAVHQQVAQQLDRTLAIQRANSQFEVETAFKGLEFAEQQRMDDAKIHEMQVRNQLQAGVLEIKKRELELQSQEQPLIHEANLLRLQAAKDSRKAQIEQYKAGQFDKTAAIFDDQMGMFLIGTESTDAAKEYYGLKANWRNRVANGEAFDADAYSTEMNNIMSKYKDVTPTGAWSPESQMIFDSVSPNLGKNYQLKNPIIGRNSNALGGAIIGSSDSDFADIMGKYGSLWNDEYRGLLGTNRVTFKQNEARVRQNHDELERLIGIKSKLDPETNKDLIADYDNRIQSLQQESNTLWKTNQKIMQDAMSGKLGVIEPPAVPAAPQSTRLNLPSLDESAKGEGLKPVFSVPPSKDSVYGKVYDRLKDVKTMIDPEDRTGIGRSLDLSWFSDNVTGEVDYKTINNIRTSIERDLDSLEDVDEVFNPESLKKLTGNLKGTHAIPISKLLGGALELVPGFTGALRRNRSVNIFKGANLEDVATGNMVVNDPNYYIAFGKPQGKMDKLVEGGKAISSPSDIEELLSVLESRSAREEAKKEIYAALIAANLKESLESK